MEYREFVSELKEAIIKNGVYDPEDVYFKPAADYPPTNGDRLCVVLASSEITREVAACNIDGFYSLHTKGASIQDISEAVCTELKKKNPAILARGLDSENYEKIKESLFIRPLPASEVSLEDVHEEVGDIALTLYIFLGKTDDDTTISMKVKLDTMLQWGKQWEEVMETAMRNTMRMAEPRFYNYLRLLIDPDNYKGDSFMQEDDHYSIQKGCMGNCLSTTEQTNGAISIFYPGVAKKIAEMFGCDFYIVFTSLHECMIHSEDTADPESLREILKGTLKKTGNVDLLTDKIYHYDRNTGKFTWEQED